MIRVAQDSDFPSVVSDESLVRICGLRLTYGEVPFIQYFTDGEGALLAVMDRVGIFFGETVTDEWYTFLSMNSEIAVVHCSATIGGELMAMGGWQGDTGVVMKYTAERPDGEEDGVKTSPYLPDVYALLKDHFPHIAPFDYWYPDASHRVRHGRCHISTILDGKTVISTAMTVAETDGAAVLGQVATHPDYRRMGLAGRCINSTISQCKDKELYILPITKEAQKLYEKLGFSAVGGWAELERA